MEQRIELWSDDDLRCLCDPLEDRMMLWFGLIHAVGMPVLVIRLGVLSGADERYHTAMHWHHLFEQTRWNFGSHLDHCVRSLLMIAAMVAIAAYDGFDGEEFLHRRQGPWSMLCGTVGKRLRVPINNTDWLSVV